MFGGATTTLTDVAVAAGRARIGHLAPRRTGRDAERILDTAGALLAGAVDRARTARGAVPLVAVGGARSSSRTRSRA